MFDYTAIAEQIRMVSWSNNSHPTGIVNQFTGPTFQLSATHPCNQKDKQLEIRRKKKLGEFQPFYIFYQVYMEGSECFCCLNQASEGELF